MRASTFKLDQCLFGYEDGHRLLASSLPLGSEASWLTELSDLAPGAVFGTSASYWTGVPVPGLGRYALMRTWPAPEMPRPGCVWTHVILMEPSVLEEVRDLSSLRAVPVRPERGGDLARYRVPLAAIIEVGPDSPAAPGRHSLHRSLIASLYGPSTVPVEVDEPGALDGALFDVWSQQWPRLRRNFRFQTAATRQPRQSGGTRFDVTALLANGALAAPAEMEPEAAWLDAAATDAGIGAGGSLRRFLWRYGADVKRQRGSFRPLVEVAVLDASVAKDAGARLLRIVTDAFPEPEDANLLKQELVDGELAHAAQLDVLWYVLVHGGTAVFPAPTTAGVGRLARLWPERPDDLLHLAECTADADDALARSVFETVTGAIPTDSFWALTGPFPRVRRRMLEARPDLLAAEGVLELDNATFATLLETVPADAGVVDVILPRLLERDDQRLADVAFDRFPRPAAIQVISAADGGGVRVGRAWLRGLVRRPGVLLDADVMGRITRTSLLYELGEALGWLTPAVVAAGTEPWIAALVDVASDLPDERRDVLRAFLVALALMSGGDGGRRVLEKFFDAVHGQELKSRLPWRARDLLIPLLPDVGWGRGWDYGLRLRLAVAAAYVRNGYPPESYAALSKLRKVRTMLADAADDVKGGKPYAKAANA